MNEIAHLFGNERTVGKILLMGRAMCVDSKRHTHLPGGYRQSLYGENTGVGVQHLDLPFVREVHFRLIGYDGQYVARTRALRISKRPAPMPV